MAGARGVQISDRATIEGAMPEVIDRAIQLKIYDDRLVIGDPGGLLPGLSVAQLEGKYKARNPLLAGWLHTRFGPTVKYTRTSIAGVLINPL